MSNSSAFPDPCGIQAIFPAQPNVCSIRMTLIPEIIAGIVAGAYRPPPGVGHCRRGKRLTAHPRSENARLTKYPDLKSIAASRGDNGNQRHRAHLSDRVEFRALPRVLSQ